MALGEDTRYLPGELGVALVGALIQFLRYEKD
jgi:hypothetical protein